VTPDYSPLQRLSREQVEASTPYANVWLTASAGTGKTQVLTARVLRLLLSGVKPESILCLTFTKAGATEMAERVNSRLAAWVRAENKQIRTDLFHLGEKNDDQTIDYARTLFARNLDARGAGLRIMTIHSFCQSLLAAFPTEAGLSAGFRPMEEAEARRMADTVLADLVSHASATHDTAFINRLQKLALAKGELGARSYLAACARAHRALADIGSGVGASVRTRLGLPLADISPLILTGCTDGNFDRAGIDQIARANVAWGAVTGLKRADAVANWLNLQPAARVTALQGFVDVWTKQDGERRVVEKGLGEIAPQYADLVKGAFEHFNVLIEVQRLDDLAVELTDALLIGQRYADAYASAKRKSGGVDFDDLIHTAAALLRKPGVGDWIRFKLDQSTDHILVDEAQDTNDLQWAIIQALADDFYSGEGAKSGAARTIFAVGDSKQAIFGFQGTDPRAMNSAREWFDRQAREGGRPLSLLNLAQSYRSSAPILKVVDAVIDEVGAERMGVTAAEPRHHSSVGTAGYVELLPPTLAAPVSAESVSDEGQAPASSVRDHAKLIAQYVAAALNGGMWIEDRIQGKSRPLLPKDVMILLRNRGELAPLIVARLHEENVPVAGIDRLRLNTPLVVNDVMAAMRFALQPLDDLNLACLLRSPLLDWSEEDLQLVCIGRGKGALWPHLRQISDSDKLTKIVRPKPGEAESRTSTVSHRTADFQQAGDVPSASSSASFSDRLAPLYDLLNMADRYGPARFIEALLSGPICGRLKLVKRFGEEARDPLEELINAALTFERQEVPSLQGFVRWFERGDVDIKRDASATSDAVRILTVHGAKGLQAPLVILADATRSLGGGQDRLLEWPMDEGSVPIPRPAAAHRVGALLAATQAAQSRDLEEHWRLLYVALTRAEQRLMIAGSLERSSKGVAPQESWHAAVHRALLTLGAQPDAAGIITFGTAALAGSFESLNRTLPKTEMSHGLIVPAGREPEPSLSPTQPDPLEAASEQAFGQPARPSWLDTAAPQELRPAKPLTPSALTQDTSANPPPSPLLVATAERGRLLHALFERLPGVTGELRRAAADTWLEASAGVADANARAKLVDDALIVIENPAYQDFFSNDALAEAPIVGVVDGVVIAGTVDRLLVTEAHVMVVDFKTSRRVPRTTNMVPDAHMRQMAAYVAVLGGIFPAKTIQAALLYTSGPTLLPLNPALLAEHKPSFQLEQQVLTDSP
jgi:ATP-dependent helicase/nuclease subunit A